MAGSVCEAVQGRGVRMPSTCFEVAVLMAQRCCRVVWPFSTHTTPFKLLKQNLRALLWISFVFPFCLFGMDQHMKVFRADKLPTRSFCLYLLIDHYVLASVYQLNLSPCFAITIPISDMVHKIIGFLKAVK